MSTCRRSSANARRPSKRLTCSPALDAVRSAASPPWKAPPTAATTRPTASTAATASPMTRPLTRPSVVGGHRLQEVGEAGPRRLAAGWHMLARHAVRGRLVAAQDLPRDALAVDLVGAVVEARGTGGAGHGLERQGPRVNQRARGPGRSGDAGAAPPP